ncbi:CopG family ribbon-helix-helix protein [Pseudoduganella violacea]|uniref:Putative transcriptional regulator n=1 Tax=Pseudoduganella violacea TaxID=1715466 RepID=A0A7W5BAL3_9BURK|nr:ribbon-helix-helix protein, CopG family [Pseudoduganella violacea]MBB3119652.1 putative transcriptional regulator [Pseudoduganella violacea]
MSNNDILLSETVPQDLINKVDQIAARLEKPRNQIIREALADWLAQEDHRFQLTKEALDDVDAGRVVDHQAIEAWAASLETDSPLLPSHK